MGIRRNITRGEEQHVEKVRREPNPGGDASACLCLVMMQLGAK